MNPFLQRLGIWLDIDSARRASATRAREAGAPGYGYVNLPGCAVRYREHGHGPDCYVFAADPPVVLEHYDRLVQLLSPNARVLILELPGFGFSPVWNGFDFTLEASVAAMASALTQLSVRRATLCFPCVSAYLALRLASARPDLVARLLLAQAPDYAGALAWKQRRDPRGLLARPVLGQLAMQVMARRRLPDWFALAVGQREQLAFFTEVAAQRLAQGARWPLASAFQQFLVDGGAPEGVEQPVIALWGQRDRSHRDTDRESSRQLGRSVELVSWQDVGHFPELEAPERFVELLLAGPWPEVPAVQFGSRP